MSSTFSNVTAIRSLDDRLAAAIGRIIVDSSAGTAQDLVSGEDFQAVVAISQEIHQERRRLEGSFNKG